MKEQQAYNKETCIIKVENRSDIFQRLKNTRLFKLVMKQKYINYSLFRLVTYLLLFDIAFVCLYPFLYMIVASIKTNADLYDINVNWIPKSIKFMNYILAFKAMDYLAHFKISAIYTVIGTIGHILGCSFIGYGFARYRFPGKNLLFLIVLLEIIVPTQTLIIPLYMTFSNIKWINTFLPVLAPTFFGFGLKGGLFILIFRQLYLSIPNAMEEAARIDGCNFLRIYWNIVLPIAKSAFLVSLVFSVVWHWNDFYEPTIYASQKSMLPLPSMLNSIIEFIRDAALMIRFDNPEAIINKAVLMAGIFLTILPVIIVFAFVQRKFMQGIERTGLVE